MEKIKVFVISEKADNSWVPFRAMASEVEAKRFCPDRSDVDIFVHTALVIDEEVFLIQKHPKLLLNQDMKQRKEAIKTRALAKLNDEERELLGL